MENPARHHQSTHKFVAFIEIGMRLVQFFEQLLTSRFQSVTSHVLCYVPLNTAANSFVSGAQ